MGCELSLFIVQRKAIYLVRASNEISFVGHSRFLHSRDQLFLRAVVCALFLTQTVKLIVYLSLCIADCVAINIVSNSRVPTGYNLD